MRANVQDQLADRMMLRNVSEEIMIDRDDAL